jgi:hypothetical protein
MEAKVYSDLIKDTGDCGDGSVFQGYYLRAS